MYGWIARLCVAVCCVVVGSGCMSQSRTMDVSGRWRFQMYAGAPEGAGDALPTIVYEDSIELPGTTETRRKGPMNSAREPASLTRLYWFEGAAFYERVVDVPKAWAGKHVTLTMERAKHTRVWVDGVYVGESRVWSAPQSYDLGVLKPGEHRLTVLVDNREKLTQSESHLWSNNTQGNWNGILGRIELHADDPVHIGSLRVDPDAAARRVRVSTRMENLTGKAAEVTVLYRVRSDAAVEWVETTEQTVPPGGGTVEHVIELNGEAPLWDEFDPRLLELRVETAAGDSADRAATTFGLVDFETRGSQFAVNGRATFLRGKHDGCVFPLTGHPPMDAAGWRSYFETCKQYGINHVRFHSWCPPKAAFVAADELGIYLQPELPFWGDFTADVRAALTPEGEAILDAYGDHPSFVMFTLGNEHWGGREEMRAAVEHFRAYDGDRRLYAHGANTFMWDPVLQPAEDYIISTAIKNDPHGPARLVRGGQPTFNGEEPGHIQHDTPGTRTDFAAAIDGVGGPVISHENGQWSVFPDFSEIEKYTGVLAPRNLERFRDRLRDAGMLERRKAFQAASGGLAVRLYREDIESCLRTPGHGGFELLDLQDYPGQGTALVGILDAFMDSKGLISPEAWREFCAPVVVLARFDKHAWSSEETFAADVQVAHYGEADIEDCTLRWTLRASDGLWIASGFVGPVTIEQGNVRDIGPIVAPLDAVREPTAATLTIEAEDRPELRTSYDIWVFPPAEEAATGTDVLVATSYDAAVRERLAGSGRVLLCLDDGRVMVRSPGGDFATDFWNWPMFHNPPGTMGLLIDDEHPALAGFPTAFHSDWQWFDIAERSQPISLRGLPAELTPIVQTIDNAERVDELGLVFECRVGEGRLLVCASPLVELAADGLAARALLESLRRYAGSDVFQPKVAISPEAAAGLFRTAVAMRGTASASSEVADWPILVASRASDRNIGTVWQSKPTAKSGGVAGEGVIGIVEGGGADGRRGVASGEVWWRFDFDEPVSFETIEIVWAAASPDYRYEVELLIDGDWVSVGGERASGPGELDRLSPEGIAAGVASIRVVFHSFAEDQPPSIREFRLLEPAR